jgi:hypothetical protein
LRIAARSAKKSTGNTTNVTAKNDSGEVDQASNASLEIFLRNKGVPMYVCIS